MWILLLQGYPEEHFNPRAGLPCWATIIPHHPLMWFGRTWWGRAGPKVISRTVTSETHFPAIKEREGNYQDQRSPVSKTWSQTFARVCVCVSSTFPPQSLTDTHAFPTLNSDRAFPKENHLSLKMRNINADKRKKNEGEWDIKKFPRDGSGSQKGGGLHPVFSTHLCC